jgi:uncharacterized protein YcbX
MKIIGLFYYPVKSLPGTSLVQANVDGLGLAGDRRWMVVDETGMFLTFRDHPVMASIVVTVNEEGIILSHAVFGSIQVRTPERRAPEASVTVWKDTVNALVADDAAHVFLSRIFQKSVRLVYLSDPKARRVDQDFGRSDDHTSFADAFSVLLTTTASLDALNHQLASPVEMRRFRPNIVVEATIPWAEDTWRLVRTGNVQLRVVKSCARCVMTTRDPDTGIQTDPQEPLRSLAKIHRSPRGKISFGQNLMPDGAGALHVGDAIEVLESGPSNLI